MTQRRKNIMIENSMRNLFTSSDETFRSSIRTILIIFGLMMGAGIGGTLLISSFSRSSTPAPSSQSSSQSLTAQGSPITPTRAANPYNILIAQGSQGATNLLTKGPFDATAKLVSYLPDNIKHINFLSAQEVIFIDELNEFEHGSSIKKYDATTKTTETLVQSQTGWGIDDVVVSPDGTHLAWWEVKFTDSDQLIGGSSRVFTKQILPSPSSPVLLTDEIASETVPIHYPLFFDGANRLYLDTFIPNGGGFYLGLSVVENGSSTFTPLPDMKDGDYLSDPQLSPDGSKILFTAYDPSASVHFTSLSGLAVNRVTNTNPNLLVIKDLSLGTKYTVGSSEGGVQYVNPKWSSDAVHIAYQKYHLTGETTYDYDGVFTMQLGTPGSQKLTSVTDNRLALLGFLNSTLIWGKTTRDVGSLSSRYAPILSEIRSTDISSDQTVPILSEPLIQYIGLTDGNIEGTEIAVSHGSIQFSSFKPKIVAQKRQRQQNDPPKPTPTPDPHDPTPTPGGPTPTRLPFPNPSLPKCRDYCNIPEPKPLPPSCFDINKCFDSPLYLYPPSDTAVKIQTHGATIFSDVPAMEGNIWEVIARKDGKIVKGSTVYNSIQYSYVSHPQPPPSSGVVVRKKDLIPTLKSFAEKFKLNERETQDFITFWNRELPDAAYYLISFYPPETVRKIIRLTFDPNPDSFIQLIMYFRPLDYQVKLPPPIFPQFERKGFVAVDWSGVIDE